MGVLVQDFRYAARTFLRSPAFTATAVITLALGIGANTAIFSLVHTLLLQPLPYRDPSRLIVVWDTYLPQDKSLPMSSKFGVSPPELELWRQQDKIFEETAWYRYVAYELDLTAPGIEALSVRAGFLSANFLRVLGMAPVLGRAFASSTWRFSELLGSTGLSETAHASSSHRKRCAGPAARPSAYGAPAGPSPKHAPVLVLSRCGLMKAVAFCS
jgi:MacB-like periplasmic core domain